MPQPVSRIPKIKSMVFLPDIFEMRPRHISVAYKIVMAAAEADRWVGQALIGLSPERGEALADHYAALEGDGKKQTAVESAALSLLTPEMHKLFKRVLRYQANAVKRRHPFAHHNIGYSPDDDTVILLRDPRKLLHEMASRAKIEDLLPKAGYDFQSVPKEIADKLWAVPETPVMAYSLKEMLEIVDHIEKASKNLRHFWLLTTQRVTPEISDDILSRLIHDLDN